MSINVVQTIFDGFSSPILYAALVWFATVGYLVSACVVMLLTRLSFKQIMWPLCLIYAQCLALAYVLTPVTAMWYVFIEQIFLIHTSPNFLGLMTYNIFAVLTIGRLPLLLHRIFAQGSAQLWTKALSIALGLTTFLGIFVLSGLKLI